MHKTNPTCLLVSVDYTSDAEKATLNVHIYKNKHLSSKQHSAQYLSTAKALNKEAKSQFLEYKTLSEDTAQVCTRQGPHSSPSESSMVKKASVPRSVNHSETYSFSIH